jgi:hypothetical protein
LQRAKNTGRPEKVICGTFKMLEGRKKLFTMQVKCRLELLLQMGRINPVEPFPHGGILQDVLNVADSLQIPAPPRKLLPKV